jgi:hypothetical protein
VIRSCTTHQALTYTGRNPSPLAAAGWPIFAGMDPEATAYALYEIAAEDASRAIAALHASRPTDEARVDQTVRPIDASKVLVRIESIESILADDGELARRGSNILTAARVAHHLVGDGVRRRDPGRPR